LPDCLVFFLKLFPAGVFWDINAEQAQARETAVDGLDIFSVHGVEQDLQVEDGGMIDLRRRALLQLHD
jgi:hypothetical protein